MVFPAGRPGLHAALARDPAQTTQRTAFGEGGLVRKGERHDFARADYMEKERVGLQSEHQEEVHADTHGAAAGNI